VFEKRFWRIFVMNEKKVRQHKLTDKNPYISSIILVLVGVLIFSLVSTVLNVIIAIPFEGYSIQYGPIGLIVGVAVGLLVYKLWFKGEFTSFFRYGKLGPGVPLVVVYIIYLSYANSARKTYYQFEPLAFKNYDLFKKRIEDELILIKNVCEVVSKDLK